ncbi:4-(cytidine 5'-diphospho)-2-C-methyl-D-erythritol kinase [bacterium]|nr:4-(cytidine 5'-diphospho)-2-C-methyl-D-erythritol kinase [bacterium]
MVELTARSFAKINLHLNVLGKREENYHEVETLIQIINLCDIIEFKETKENKISLSSNYSSIEPTNNTVIKALELLRIKGNIKRGVEVFLNKRIPIGSGLGGGSSNAASSLMVMNYMWDLNFPIFELREIGKKVGADVPAFLSGSLSYATGRGDEIKELPTGEIKDLLVVFPGIFISTKEAYESLDSILTKNIIVDKIASSFAFLSKCYKGYFNNFEDVVFLKYPELGKIKEFLYSQGAEFSQMTGSGSAVFGIFDDVNKCNDARKRVEGELDYKVFTCRFMSFDSSKLLDELLDI